MSFERARKIADAVLYEGYILYPYRPSAPKNQVRWQFGVLAPRAWCESGGCESAWSQTECLVEAAGPGRLSGKMRFLQLQRRTVEEASVEGFRPVASLEAGGRLWTTWDEGLEREVELGTALEGESTVRFDLPAGREVEAISGPDGPGRIVRELWPLAGEIQVAGERLDDRLVKVRIRIQNITPWDAPGARETRRCAGRSPAHILMLAVEGGQFVSLLEPPGWAAAAAKACQNVRTWPVLVGPSPQRDVLLSSPIILYDYPEVAKERPRRPLRRDRDRRDPHLAHADAHGRGGSAKRAPRMRARPPSSIVWSRCRPRCSTACTVPSVRCARPHPRAATVPRGGTPERMHRCRRRTDSVEIQGVAVAKEAWSGCTPDATPTRRTCSLEGRLAVRPGRLPGRGRQALPRRDASGRSGPQTCTNGYGRYLYFSPEEVEPAGKAP